MNTRRVAAFGAGLAAGAAAGWIAYSRFRVNHSVEVEPPLGGDLGTVNTAAGAVASYTVKGVDGPPIAFIHSVNAAASAYEMQPLYDYYRGHRTVMALDLPGFGFSERADAEYSPELYERAIADWIEGQAGQPVDAVALSLGGEFAARAALARPDLFRSLTLISPTGFAADRNPQPRPALLGAFSFPLWAQALYDLLTTPASIRYYLKKSFAGPIDEGLAAYDFATSHRPGARYAPLRFISGMLFTPDVRERVYARLQLPVLAIYDRDGYVNFDELPGFVAQHPNWTTARIVPTCGLPHFEKRGETVAAMERFWASVPAPSKSL